jgi:tellurite resistance protein TehA-like permease
MTTNTLNKTQISSLPIRLISSLISANYERQMEWKQHAFKLCKKICNFCYLLFPILTARKAVNMRDVWDSVRELDVTELCFMTATSLTLGTSFAGMTANDKFILPPGILSCSYIIG